LNCFNEKRVNESQFARVQVSALGEIGLLGGLAGYLGPRPFKWIWASYNRRYI